MIINTQITKNFCSRADFNVAGNYGEHISILDPKNYGL